MPINSWSITTRKYVDSLPLYVYRPIRQEKHDRVDLIFHGARNTDYILYFVNDDRSIHSSLGTPSDYRYFYGVNFFDPSYTDSTFAFYLSTYLGLSNIKEGYKFFNNKEFIVKTDNSGNFTFTLTVCGAVGHNAYFSSYIYLQGYKQHQLKYTIEAINSNPNGY